MLFGGNRWGGHDGQMKPSIEMNEITRWVWEEKTRGSWHEVVSSLIFHSWLFSAISVGSNGVSPPSHTPSHFQQGRSIYVALFFLFLSTQQSPSSDTFQRKWNTCPCVLSHCHPGTQTASRRSPSTYSNLGFIQLSGWHLFSCEDMYIRGGILPSTCIPQQRSQTYRFMTF